MDLVFDDIIFCDIISPDGSSISDTSVWHSLQTYTRDKSRLVASEVVNWGPSEELVLAVGQSDWSYTWNRKVTDPVDSIISILSFFHFPPLSHLISRTCYYVLWMDDSDYQFDLSFISSLACLEFFGRE